MSLGVGKIKKTRKSTSARHKTEEKVHMQASNRGTKGLGKLFGAGCSWWEKGVAGKLATCSHAPPTRRRVVTFADGRTRVEHCLMSGFLPTCRSGGR